DQVAGTAIDASVVAAVHRRTSGNPLLAQEVLAGLGARGGWDDPRAVAAAIPETTRALVVERLASVPAETRSVLAPAAAIGTSFALDVLAESLGKDDMAVLDALGPAVGAGVLSALGSAGGAFAHDLIRDVVWDVETAAAR